MSAADDSLSRLASELDPTIEIRAHLDRVTALTTHYARLARESDVPDEVLRRLENGVLLAHQTSEMVEALRQDLEAARAEPPQGAPTDADGEARS